MENKVLDLLKKINDDVFSKFRSVDRRVKKFENHLSEVNVQLKNNEQGMFDNYSEVIYRLDLLENKIDHLLLRIEMADKLSFNDAFKITAKQ